MTVEIAYFEVVQPNYQVVQTNEEVTGEDFPDVEKFSGTVTFTPSADEVHSPDLDSTIVLRPIRGRFQLPDGKLRTLNGSEGVQLVDNQHLGLPATGSKGALTYRVDYSNVVFDGASNRRLAPFRFAAPGDGTQVNLNTVARLPL